IVPAVDQTAELRSCPHCAAQMPGNAAFCPGCGRSMRSAVRAQGKVGGLSENIAGGLSYFTFLPALVFLLLEPFKKSGFVRFHSMQCLLVTCALILAGLAAVFVWLVLVVKALQGETFKLAWLGDLAERYSGGV